MKPKILIIEQDEERINQFQRNLDGRSCKLKFTNSIDQAGILIRNRMYNYVFVDFGQTPTESRRAMDLINAVDGCSNCVMQPIWIIHSDNKVASRYLSRRLLIKNATVRLMKDAFSFPDLLKRIKDIKRSDLNNAGTKLETK